MSKSLIKFYTHFLLTSALILANCFSLTKVLATPTPPGTIIENTATGSFQGVSDTTTYTTTSNTVTLTVVEVAGITIENTGITEAPNTVTNAGLYQGIAGYNTGDVVYFEFTITNVGNDPTKFFIPDSPSSVVGATFNKTTLPIQIIAVDPDGSTGATPEKVLTTPVNVSTGNDTIALLGSPDGYIPPDGTVKVRVPVKVTETTVGNNISVTLGNTPASPNNQNQAYIDSTNNTDVYTIDFADGTAVPTATGYTGTTPEANGNPANGDTTNHRQEASNTQSIVLAETPVVQGYKSVKLTGDLDTSNSVSANDELTWTITYKNTSGVAITNFQISDILDANTTRTGASAMSVEVKIAGVSQTAPTLKATYTGVAPNTDLIDTTTPYTLPANAVITINIPVKILNGTPNNTLISNQTTATATNLPTAGTLTDNIDNSTTGLPTDVTVPTSSISQNQLPTIDPTVVITGLPTLEGYKSVKLTTDNGTTGLNPGDVVTWTIIYKNTGTIDIPNFQITDTLPTGVQRNATPITITATGSGQVTPTVNPSYNGTGTDTLFQTAVTLKAGATIVVNIPVDVKTGTEGTSQSNQSVATGSNINTPVNTDNVDSDTGMAEVPPNSIKQSQNPTIDPTVINIPNTPAPIISGYKSVKLTNDADTTTTITPGDTLTWTLTYVNTGTVDATNFQINDTLLSGLTVAATPTISTNTTQGAAPTANSAYTGASPNTTLLQNPITFKAGGIITVTIPVTIDTGVTGDKLNQAIASGTNITDTNTDNIDNTTTGLPIGVTVDTGSVNQTQNPSIDPTKVTILTISGGTPNVLLVKRITAINGGVTPGNGGEDIDKYHDQNSSHPAGNYPYDDNTLDSPAPTPPDTTYWPDPENDGIIDFLKGAINGGTVDPNDTLEYSIYFLSTGTADAKNVILCDRLPQKTVFIPDTYEAGKGITLYYDLDNNGTIESTSLTNIGDGDRGRYIPPGVALDTFYADIATSKLCGQDSSDSSYITNSTGVVVVKLGIDDPDIDSPADPIDTLLPKAIAPGDPKTSYGYMRFQVKFTE